MEVRGLSTLGLGIAPRFPQRHLNVAAGAAEASRLLIAASSRKLGGGPDGETFWLPRPEPSLVTAVRDGDAMLMPSGYHPNVSVPGHRIAFLWAMAAHNEVEDRQFGVVNVQPGFQQGSSGLEAGRK